MHYGNIKNYDIADGEGVRVTLFCSGCTNRCEGCFQPETWDFCYGKEYTKETEDQLIQMLTNPNIQGLTLLGGDPFEPSNQRTLITLLRRVKQELPTKDVMLSYIDLLVDGPFVIDQKDISLYFRGSTNQRVIDMPKTLKSGNVVIYHE